MEKSNVIVIGQRDRKKKKVERRLHRGDYSKTTMKPRC